MTGEPSEVKEPSEYWIVEKLVAGAWMPCGVEPRLTKADAELLRKWIHHLYSELRVRRFVPAE